MYIEKIDDLEIMIDKCYNITNDAIDLAQYVLDDNIKTNDMLEIGTGSGYISIKLRNLYKNIVALDIQKEACINLENNLKENSIENIKVVNEDIKKHNGLYDSIISNPPFFKINSGKLPSDEIKLIAKFEKELNVSQLMYAIQKLLKNGGIFYLIYPKDRLNDIIKESKKQNLQIITTIEKGKRYIIKGEKK